MHVCNHIVDYADAKAVQVRLKAIKVALAMVSGAYSTGLVSYFTHRDLFPSLMKVSPHNNRCYLGANSRQFVQDSEQDIDNLSPFVLLGLLVNYNKFEFQNPYRLRLDDFVNEGIIKKIVACIGHTSQYSRSRYTEIQEDLPEGWSFGNTLAYIGLGALAGNTRKPAPPTLTPEEAKARFTALPGPEALLLLSTYDFANANKMFCFTLVSHPPDSKTEVPPISSYLSLISYMVQHAHRSTRAAHYTYISLFTLQILVEDQVLAKRLCSDESKTAVRLCRQRQPFLPLVQSERVLMAAILDICVDGINHNLRRRLDVDLYMFVNHCLQIRYLLLTWCSLFVGILLRIASYLGRSRTRLGRPPNTPHHNQD